jgi:hypothetical protein
MMASKQETNGSNSSGRPIRNLAIAGSAAAAIFAATLGANAFDISSASPTWRSIYRGVIAGWAVAVLLIALVTYLGGAKSSDGQPLTEEQLRQQERQERQQHRWHFLIAIFVGLLALATVVALVSAGRESTRDQDTVRLRVSPDEFKALRKLCGVNLEPDRIDGKVRVPSEKEQFVIFDFLNKDTHCTQSVDIPAREILAMQEDPSR